VVQAAGAGNAITKLATAANAGGGARQCGRHGACNSDLCVEQADRAASPVTGERRVN